MMKDNNFCESAAVSWYFSLDNLTFDTDKFCIFAAISAERIAASYSCREQ